jgi:hypothetical protein
LYRVTVDRLFGSSIYVGIRLNLSAEEKPFHGWIVTSISDKDNNNLRYEYIPLYWFRADWNYNSTPFINGMLIHTLPDEVVSVVTYVWNIGGKPYTVRDCGLEIYKLERDY